jgi:hypothetical protein
MANEMRPPIDPEELGFSRTSPPTRRVPNAKTRAAIEETRKGGLESFATVSELLADLNAKD